MAQNYISKVRYPVDANDFLLSPHFKAKEIECPCCKKIVIIPRLYLAAEKTRERLGIPISVSSGCRCRKYQVYLYKEINRKRESMGLSLLRIPKVGYHVTGEAIDSPSIIVPGEVKGLEEVEYIEGLRDDGWVGIGIQKQIVRNGKIVQYGFTHLDVRLAASVIWYYGGGR